MPTVKSTRAYDSPRRREQAALTRRAILEGAARLFLRKGYAATSVPEIAAEAGVALKTVYVTLETKAGVLRALWTERLAGEEASIPVFERAWYRQVVDERRPEHKLRLVARHSSQVKTNSGELMEVIRAAASADAEIAELWQEIETKLHSVSRAIVGQLDEQNALAEGLNVEAAADRLWTLNHPSVWYLLVKRRGWNNDAYATWLAESLTAQLLRRRRVSSGSRQ